MNSEELMNLRGVIKSSLNSESMENLQSVLNNTFKEVFQNQCVPADGSVVIDIVVNFTTTEEQSDSLVPPIKLNPGVLNRCVWTSLGFRCS